MSSRKNHTTRAPVTKPARKPFTIVVPPISNSTTGRVAPTVAQGRPVWGAGRGSWFWSGGARRSGCERGLGAGAPGTHPGAPHRVDDPDGEERGEPDRVVIRALHADLHEPEVVEQAQDRDDIDEPVEPPPGHRAESPDH